ASCALQRGDQQVLKLCFEFQALIVQTLKTISPAHPAPTGSALQLPQQAPHVAVHVGIAGPQVFDQPHGVDHR
ncbi:MAG: hypothetical protein ACKOPM_07640, partial [Novosphingobium sp.]